MLYAFPLAVSAVVSAGRVNLQRVAVNVASYACTRAAPTVLHTIPFLFSDLQ